MRISITKHYSYNTQNLDANPSLDAKGIFLDMSKAFDKVWHEGLIYKLRSYGVQSKLIDLLGGVRVIRRLYHYLPRESMIQIYKSFIRPHLDYCDIIYHKPLHDIFSSEYYSERASSDPLHNNEQFTNKIEAVQYNSALAMPGCIRGTLREKL